MRGAAQGYNCAMQTRIGIQEFQVGLQAPVITDVAACMVDYLRYRAVRDEVNAGKEAIESRSNLKWSARFLACSAFLLGLGAVAVVFTFVRVLWS